jgi:hypothetical protein
MRNLKINVAEESRKQANRRVERGAGSGTSFRGNINRGNSGFRANNEQYRNDIRPRSLPARAQSFRVINNSSRMPQGEGRRYEDNNQHQMNPRYPQENG